jgi:D-glycero-D-manno-heptose 1,7-bisphosphate phosphatase
MGSAAERAGRRFVLLDRDGTLIVEKHYLADPDGVELLPHTLAGLDHLRRLDLGLLVLTNQSGLGRGYFGPADLEAVHRRLNELLAEGGIRLDGIHACGDLPDSGSIRRKPEPGMVWEAMREHGFDPAAAFVIGDQVCDVQLARRVGATAVLVRTGYGEQARRACTPDYYAEHLLDAARWIEGRLG